MDSRRQEKFAKLIQKDLSSIFLEKKSAWFGGRFITISNVKISPDLGYAKVYLSFLNEKNKEEAMQLMELYNRDIRRELASRIRNQVRKIPELQFYLDDALDYALHMEEVFKKLNEKKEGEE